MKNQFIYSKQLKNSLILIILIVSSCAKKTNNIALSVNFLKEASVEAEAGNFQKALQAAEKAYKLNPSPQTNSLRATLLYQLKQFNESLTLFKKIIDDKKTPDNLRADIKNNYACNLLFAKKSQEARHVWIDLTHDKNYLSPEVAWYNLGLLEFTEAIELKNHTDESKRIQSKVHFANASKLFEKAIDIACNYIDAYFYLALCLEQMGDYEQAKENILMIISKYENHEPAKQLLKRIDEQIMKQRRVN